MILTIELILKDVYIGIINLIMEGLASIHSFPVKMVSHRYIT